VPASPASEEQRGIADECYGAMRLSNAVDKEVPWRFLGNLKASETADECCIAMVSVL
jgi:hypothetical protein